MNILLDDVMLTAHADVWELGNDGSLYAEIMLNGAGVTGTGR